MECVTENGNRVENQKIDNTLNLAVEATRLPFSVTHSTKYIHFYRTLFSFSIRFMCLMERNQEKSDRESFFSEAYSEHSKNVDNVVVKWGVYEIIDRSVPVEQMCDRVLLAADSIKGQYNQFYAVYDDNLRGKLLREKAIADVMETALAEEQFIVYLQPKYSLSDNRMVGAEALVRWIHPEWGFMSPGEFIPLFEKNGFIPRLDQYVCI